jgi:hypothetical protein
MRKILICLVVLAAIGAVPGNALAHTLSGSTAKSAAIKKAKSTAREVGASSSKVGTCRRSTSHKFVCGARINYGGGSYCTVKIEVRYKTRSSTRIVTRVYDTLCY